MAENSGLDGTNWKVSTPYEGESGITTTGNKKSHEFNGHIRNEGEPTEIYVGPKRNPLTVEVDVDVSEALTGLKALQREAKETTRLLRELEAQSVKMEGISLGDDFFRKLRQAFHAKKF